MFGKAMGGLTDAWHVPDSKVMSPVAGEGEGKLKAIIKASTGESTGEPLDSNHQCDRWNAPRRAPAAGGAGLYHSVSGSAADTL
jgi:hypothetical protein